MRVEELFEELNLMIPDQDLAQSYYHVNVCSLAVETESYLWNFGAFQTLDMAEKRCFFAEKPWALSEVGLEELIVCAH